MLVSDFNNDFEKYVHDQELEKANDRLIEELANILVDKKDDFIDMLNESGIEADESMPKSQLIELFTENTDNKNLLVGASLLANSYSKDLSFDGQDSISDENVKIGYALLNENFNGDEQEDVQDEEFSYIAPLLGGLIKGGVALWRNNRQRQGKSTQIGSDNFNREIARRREAARRRMERQAIQRQQVMLQQQRIAAEDAKRKRRNVTLYVVLGTVLVSAIVGGVILMRKR